MARGVVPLFGMHCTEFEHSSCRMLMFWTSFHVNIVGSGVGVGGGASRIPPLRDVRAGVFGRPRPLPPLRPRRLGRSTRTRPTPRPPPRRHRTHPAHTHGRRRRRARRERNRRRRARRGTRVLRVDPRRGVGRRDATRVLRRLRKPGRRRDRRQGATRGMVGGDHRHTPSRRIHRVDREEDKVRGRRRWRRRIRV